MKPAFLSAGVLVLLFACSPDNRRNNESGMADSAAGGLSSRDTLTLEPVHSGAESGGSRVTPEGVLSQMNVANTTEIQLSTLAARKAASAKVKQIAKQLARDHTKNREQVRALAQKVNVTLTASQGGRVSGADSVALPPDLQGKSGADFDQAFIQHEIDDHQSNIDRIQNQILPSVQNDQIKAYLKMTVTEMRGHLSRLQQVQQQLGG